MLTTSESTYEAPAVGLKNLNLITIGSKVKDTFSAVNAMTGRMYSGVNRLILADALIKSGYKSNVWATFYQAKQIGLEVSVGQKPTKIMYWKQSDGGESQLEYASLYNMEQMDVSAGYQEDSDNLDRISNCSGVLRMISKADVMVSHTSLASGYQRKTDTVLIANSNQFECVDDYYGDWVKQLIHSTKHAKRLNRNYIKRTKSLQQAIACEEMVVFIALRFFCDAVKCEVPNDVKCDIYKNCWEDIVTGNAELFIQVCSDAQKVSDYMLNHWVTGEPYLSSNNYSTPIGLTCSL